MPPANSPDREPTPSTNFISALRDLESPVNEDVLNLAATLTTQVSDDDIDEHYASLRTLEHDQQRLQQSRERLRQLERTRDEIDYRDRLRRSMDRLNRLHESSTATPTAQYGERVPSQNTLYDWSPLPNIEQGNDDERSLRALQSRLNMSSNLTTGAAAGDSLRSTAILQAVRRHPGFSARTRDYLQRYNQERDRERETMRNAARESRDAAREAARETATLRRSTQDPWTGPRERYQAGRNPQSQSQSHSQSHSQPQPQPQPQLQSQSQSQSQSRPQPPTVAPMLEHTVQYLSRIRHVNTVDESLNCALEAGFLSKDYFCIQYADFLTDITSIPPPRETSWLAPGAVLSGCQHATASTCPPNLATSQLPPPSRPWLSTSYSTPRSLTSYLSPNAPGRTEQLHPLPAHQDRWPVKVTIHAVDWPAMSLSATMEAYNVPSHPHTHVLPYAAPSSHQYTRTSSITTYLEGEILDFNTHTLLTESFKSSAANDAMYWRKLPPFADMRDEDVVRALTSRRWWEGLREEWVLMRWKERCFVKSLKGGGKADVRSATPEPIADGSLSANTTGLDGEREYYTYDSHTFARHETGAQPHFVDAEHAAFDDSGCGLTISGFYYVCLRRSNGRVEGLYYDPMSSPYQCLRLESEGRGRFASWDFA